MGVRVELDGCIDELLNGEDERSEEFGSAVVNSTMADKVRSAESGGKRNRRKCSTWNTSFYVFITGGNYLGKTALKRPHSGRRREGHGCGMKTARM